MNLLHEAALRFIEAISGKQYSGKGKTRKQDKQRNSNKRSSKLHREMTGMKK